MYYYPILLYILWNQFEAVSTKCTGGQVYVECVSGCIRPSCAFGILPLCLVPAKCTPGCQCPPSLPIAIRDDNNQVKCVKEEDCCKGDLIPGCEPNACSPRCDPPKEPIACPQICKLGCRCPSTKPIQIYGKDGSVQCITKNMCPVCTGGQVFTLCGSACTRTCENPNSLCTRQCVTRCQCPPNKPIWHAGKCIPEESCPECTGGQVFRACGSKCTPTCEIPNPVCTKECVMRCECPKAEPLWDGESCLTKDECPVCPGGQVFNLCGSPCTPSCENTNPLCIQICFRRCECPHDKPLWNGYRCITKAMCPNCKGGMVYKQCGPGCTPTCDLPNPQCFKRCIPGCYCPSYAPLWNGKECITKDKCPHCKGGQVFRTCGSACTATCEVPNPICILVCVARCQCPPEKPIWNGDKCITQAMCPDCPGGQVFRLCGSSCTPTCEVPNPVCTEECVTRCECPADKPLWNGVQCITQNMCPKCVGGQVFKVCGSACTPTCEVPHPICTRQCVARCQCPQEQPFWDGVQCIDQDNCDCRHPADKGPCVGHTMRWYYNIRHMQCEQFNYGGCFGNVNNFISEKDCYKKCDQSGCKYIDCSMSYCPADVKLKRGCRNKKCQCNCPCKNMKCPEGEECISVRNSNCKKPPCPFIGKCVVKVCKIGLPLPNAWCGDSIGCPDGYHCNKKFPVMCCADDICHLPPDSGCGKKDKMRWFYDADSQSCKMFRFGGGGGNKNNFKNKRACLRACLPKGCKPLKCNVICQFGYEEDKLGCEICSCKNPCPETKCKTHDVVQLKVFPCLIPPCPTGCVCEPSPCTLPKVPGPCRGSFPKYYFNYETRTCELFIYGGCGGNANQFDTLEECQGICGRFGICPIVDYCFTKCPHGNRPNKKGCYICDCHDPCHDLCCPKGQVCQPLNVKCVTSPCPRPVATCVPKKCKLGLPFQDGRRGDFCCSDKIPCPSGYECTDGVCCAIDVCSLPPDSGPCTKYKNFYYYDRSSGECKSFLYGGCGGNKNRFKSLAKCNIACIN